MKNFLNLITAAGLTGIFAAGFCSDGEVLGTAQIALLSLVSCALLAIGTYFKLRRRGEI